MSHLETTWNVDTQVLTTTLSGSVTEAQVATWRNGLLSALAQLPVGTRFKLLYDLRGFEPVDLGAHREMREVVPRLLASCGMRPAVVDLFDGVEEPTVSAERDVVCTAFANVHHDAVKMERYESTIGKADQRFFTDPDTAREWLLAR